MIRNISLKNFLLFSVLFASFFSCKKEKEKENLTKKELLSNKWTVSDVLGKDGNSIIALPMPRITCLKDNSFTLRADNSYTIDEGNVACDPSTAGSGEWALIESETKIKFTSSTDDPLIFKLIEVSAATLKIAYEITDTGIPDLDGTYTIILTKA